MACGQLKCAKLLIGLYAKVCDVFISMFTLFVIDGLIQALGLESFFGKCVQFHM